MFQSIVSGLTSALLLAGTTPPPPTSPRSVAAVRLSRAPNLTASDDDAVWRAVPAVDDFRQWSPREDAAPSFRTEFRVAYDERNLYVQVHAFDPHPDSIVRTVTRRDAASASDEIGVYIDSYGDHRNGYEFYINAAGVQRDVALSADVREDPSWDAVWDASAHVDSSGWIAEFRIPFSQLRFARAERHDFGFLVNRVVQRRAEHDSWPAYYPSRTGIVSQLGVLTGLSGIGERSTLEATPFVRSQSRGSGAVAAGADLRYGPAPNITLDATVLPDFGQVEADPSVVNLSTVETFYPEHRPFFLDGAANFSVGFDCTAFNCFGEGLFYSRRIGRAPQLAPLYDVGAQMAAPILGAAKLVARSSGGVGVAGLVARTGKVATADGYTAEPATTYGIARLLTQTVDGQSGATLIATIVDRQLDRWSTPYLARTALVNGGTFRHKFGAGQYEVWGSGSVSHLAGSRGAIDVLQRNDVHELARPDTPGRYDSTRTSLTGDQEELAVGKYGGAVNFELAYERQSRGYDANDLGYLQRADQQLFAAWLGYIQRTPRGFYRSWWWNLNQWDYWNAAGMRMETAFNTNAHMILSNSWQLNYGTNIEQLAGPLCDHCAHGGPALRLDPVQASFIDITSDPRRAFAPELYAYWRTAARLRLMSWNPSLAVRASPRVQANIGLAFTANHDGTQWFGNFADNGTMRYAFAHLDQHTRSLTLRASYAATPQLSLETYVAPFLSDGAYSDVRALSEAPRAEAYDDRFTPFTPPSGAATGFDVQQLRATSVLRWQYAPGSTLFLVWARDVANTVTVKASYWIGR